MTTDAHSRFFCPRLIDYVLVVGSRHPSRNDAVVQTPELLRRYPLDDHTDFPLPPDVVFFCQPEGCLSVGRGGGAGGVGGGGDGTSFVFALTEKDTGRTRYGVCLNFYRPFERRATVKTARAPATRNPSTSTSGSERLLAPPGGGDGATPPKSPRSRRRQKTAARVRNHTLTSLCILSHHAFFSTLRDAVVILRRLIDACNDRSCCRRIGGSKASSRDNVWSLMTGRSAEGAASLVMHEVREIETWILRLLSAPVPVPGKTRVEVAVLPADLHPPLLFALPDHTRFGLVDFPLHLPLELLGVDTCLRVLTCVILEHKIILQSRDYNALSMSVMAFVAMLYPFEYMFPVIPLLPTCMNAAEQILMAPTPFIIGIPTSFLMYKKGFVLPDDIWLIDLDCNKVMKPTGVEINLPPLPEPEGTLLKNHLRQILEENCDRVSQSIVKSEAIALASMSMTPQPIKNLDSLSQSTADVWRRKESFSSQTGFNPLIYGNDVDSVDVATRVAMVRFFNSANTLMNFMEHTRTLRLYPRPVVAFQLSSFLKSRSVTTSFTTQLARTQAVEYFAEWSLCPTNVVFLRVQTGVYDPLLIGDKAKWFSQSLQKIEFNVYDSTGSTLGAAIQVCLNESKISDENPTDESGSDSDSAESTSSSYSSLSDFVIDIQNSDINGEALEYIPPSQILSVDEAVVFTPPSRLQLPDAAVSNSDSALSAPDSDDDDDGSSDSEYAKADGATLAATPATTTAATPTPVGVMEGSTPVGPGNPGAGPPPRPPPLTYHSPGVTPPLRDEPIFRYDSGRITPTRREDGNIFTYDSGNVTPTQLTPGSSGDSPVRPPDGTPPHSLQRQGAPLSSSPRSSSMNWRISEGARSRPQGRGSGSIKGRGSGKAAPQRPPPPTPTLKTSASDVTAAVDDKAANVNSLMDELNGYAQTASHTISELFDEQISRSLDQYKGSTRGSQNQTTRSSKPFAPLGNRKALVEKSGLVKHVTNQRKTEPQRQSSTEQRTNNRSSNQQFLKELITGVLEGQGLGWLKLTRLKKLLEDENYRSFVVSRLNTSLDRKLTDENAHIEDVCVSRPVFKGMLTMVKALCSGLAHTYQNHDIGGMGSAFLILEIGHTHYWEKDLAHSNGSTNRSDASNTSLASSPYGSHESLSSVATDSKLESRGTHGSHMVAALGSPVVVNGDEFENIELRSVADANRTTDNNNVVGGRAGGRGEGGEGGAGDAYSSGYGSESGDMLRELVKNKEQMLRCAARRRATAAGVNKCSSFDSDVSDGSTMMTTRLRRSGSVLSTKSHMSTGFRYHGGKMLNLNLPSPETNRTYVFEHLIGKDRLWLWDNMQFWEDVYLDAVAQERDIIGMDQGPGEMMARYKSLGDVDRKRLEHDEDRLLATMLHNISAFMLMMRVSKAELRRKCRRLLGKAHIGLNASQLIHSLLEQINNLHGNDIDLKPLGSRMMQKQSFTVHWGADNTGDMLFMEVCDDCLILRSVSGAICDRWWYEKLVNMTYCPKTKVLCLWRKQDGKTQLNKFYTKKCKELYVTVKEAMEKAATRNNGKMPGPELGGEFPVQDLASGQGGLLQVCMEGIGLLFANSKLFIELGHIKKCFTQKGGVFVLEEFDPKSQKLIQRRFKSSMADQICYSVLCVFSYKAAGNETRRLLPTSNQIIPL